MNKEVKPLYRKVNTKARGVHHQKGSDAKYDRNTKLGVSKSMKKNKQRGLDYTPLYNFLLSKIGQDWDKIHSEAIKRLDSEEPIYHLVVTKEYNSQHNRDNGLREYVTSGNGYYSTLFVDENNLLQKVNPNLKNEDFSPSCPCCTHTFNGKVLVKKYKF